MVDGDVSEEEGTSFAFAVPAGGIARVDTWLTGMMQGFSRSRIQGLMKAGQVTAGGRPLLRSTAKVEPGERVEVRVPPPVPAEPEPEDIPLAVLYEDGDILVIDKPAGLVVHPAPGHLTGTLVNALLAHCPGLGGIGGVARPGIVHRLDQDTSGVMVVAKSQRAMDVLTREFASHANLVKTYLAIVHGEPTPRAGRIETLIGRCPFDRKKMAVVDRNGKMAVTNYRVVRRLGGTSLVECVIETGRTHQIRVHLSARAGCPIVGDGLYGRPGWDRRLEPVPTRQLLHAWRLALRHPVTRDDLVFEAPLPDDFRIYGA